jgi:Ser/Thr protein kinase RdoA (MazF antagonist)
VKGATDALTATWLRLEYSVYAHVQAPFLPMLCAWDDDGVYPLLVLEDLSGAVWHAPWTMTPLTQVLDTLQQVAATTPPVTLSSLEARRPMLAGWAHVAQDPAAILGLRLCSAACLSHALDTLMAAEAQARLAGENLVHFDVRSDNLCFVGDRVVLVDWNWACRGHSTVDIAAWLPR